MYKKKRQVLFCLLLICSSAHSQIGIGKTVIDPSAIFDLSNNTSKAFLPPRVSLGQLTDNVTPIANPADGLLVFNIGSTQIQGFYTWNNGAWNLFATDGNSVNNAVISKTTPSTGVLGGFPNGIYTAVVGGALSFNSITNVTYNPVTGLIMIPAGNYNCQISLSIQAADEIPTSGIGSTQRTHIHYYLAKLTDGITNYGGIMTDNVISNSTSASNVKQHVANFSFTFKVTTPTSFIFNIAHAVGGTYANGVGGVLPNNGQVTILNSFLHIQRSTL
jgi:hypothetical protein